MPLTAPNATFRNFVERSPHGMAMLDNDMRYVAVSKRFLTDHRLASANPSSVKGRSHYEVFPDIPERWREVHRRVLAGETLSASEDIFPRADGTCDWMSWKLEPWYKSDVSIGGLIIFCELITARKEAEISLAKSESLLRMSQEVGRIGSWEWHLETDALYWSETQCRQFGIEPNGGQPVSAELWRSAVDPRDLPRLEDKLRKLIKSGDYLESEYRIHGPFGIRWLFARIHIVRDLVGKATRLIGIDMDVTDRHILQEDLEALNRTLQSQVEEEIAAREFAQLRLAHSQNMKSIGELTGGMAHDFNNLLTVITGTIDILKDGLADRPNLFAIANSIGAAADRGAKLTSNLLAFARKQPLQPKIVHVGLVLKETCEMLQSTLGKQIRISLAEADDDVSVLVDPVQLSAALVNLGINARDAMPDGGKLTLEVGSVVLDSNEAGSRELAPGLYVTIKVSDTGTGIPDSIQKRIFEPFFTTKEIGKGTGLGLSSVFGFVKQSGGHTEVFSVEKIGTTFTIYLPFVKDHVLPSMPRPNDGLAGCTSETILCVEDDEMVSDFVTQQLRMLGYRTLVARDGSEALAIAESEEHIDLLLTDIIMPGEINGWQLAELVNQTRPAIKTLFTSGYSDPGVLGDLDQDKILLRKPYRLNELATSIRTALAT